jgi:hypothetical protein
MSAPSGGRWVGGVPAGGVVCLCVCLGGYEQGGKGGTLNTSQGGSIGLLAPLCSPVTPTPSLPHDLDQSPRHPTTHKHTPCHHPPMHSPLPLPTHPIAHKHCLPARPPLHPSIHRPPYPSTHLLPSPQVFILDCLAGYDTRDPKDAEKIVERVLPRLQHVNSAVVLSAVKVGAGKGRSWGVSARGGGGVGGQTGYDVRTGCEECMHDMITFKVHPSGQGRLSHAEAGGA